MTEYTPIFRSPIVMPEPATTASDLSVVDLTGIPITDVQGAVDTFMDNGPATPGDLMAIDDGLAARLTPRELYLFGLFPNATIPSQSDHDDIYLTDFTHLRAALKLSGPAASEMLTKISGLDFHDSVFPNMQVKQSSAAKIKTLIARCDEADVPVYHLHLNRPLGQYFWDIVWDAGQEFGITVQSS